MKETNEIQAIFQRYAKEVGRYLPFRKRQDIQFEILSLLEDNLEDQSAQQGVPIDEAMALELLKGYGPPIKFANAYRQEENLIRPATFQVFKPVATLVAGLLFLELLITLGFSVGSPWSAIWPQLVEWFEGIFTAFGILVLSFVSIERTTPEAWLRWPFGHMFADWDPAGLKPDARKKLIDPKEAWIEIFVLAGLIVLVSIFPQWVGVGANKDGAWFFLPVLSASFGIYLPWLVAYWLGRLVFLAALSRQVYWSFRMRAWEVGLKVFGLALLAALMFGPPCDRA